MTQVGIVSYGIYIPERRVTSAQISEQFDIPIEVVESKQGIHEKHVSSKTEMPSDMAYRAATIALDRAEKAGVDRKDIGAIFYVGSQWKDYNVWLMSTFLQEKLLLKHAYSMDLSAMCAGMVTGLYLSRSILSSDEDLRAVLLVGASKESYIVNPQDDKTSWMDDFADAGVAAVIARNFPRNAILKSDFLTNGSLSDGTLLVTGGAKQPFYKPYCDQKRAYLESLIPKDDFKNRLTSISLNNFKTVINGSIRKSGLRNEDISMIFLNHMKPSFHAEILESLNISPER